MAVTPSPDYGIMQRLVDCIFEHDEYVRRLDVIMLAEAFDLPDELMHIVSLLPPGTYSRISLCMQLNSSIAGHGWGLVYGTVI